jgi:hypothetical protein
LARCSATSACACTATGGSKVWRRFSPTRNSRLRAQRKPGVRMVAGDCYARGFVQVDSGRARGGWSSGGVGRAGSAMSKGLKEEQRPGALLPEPDPLSDDRVRSGRTPFGPSCARGPSHDGPLVNERSLVAPVTVPATTACYAHFSDDSVPAAAKHAGAQNCTSARGRRRRRALLRE